MKITYSYIQNTQPYKLQLQNAQTKFPMIKGGLMNFSLSKKNDGIKNDHYTLNCKFKILYAIYEMAVSLGGKMYLGASAANNGKRIGSDDLPVDTIDGFISIEFYNKKIGDKTMRRSTYYAAILDWAGFVTNHWGGYITVKKEYMSED